MSATGPLITTATECGVHGYRISLAAQEQPCEITIYVPAGVSVDAKLLGDCSGRQVLACARTVQDEEGI